MQIIYTVYCDLIRYYFCLIAGSMRVGKWQKCYTHETNIIILRSWIPCEENSSLSLAAAAAKLLQSCPTLWDPIHSSPPGPAVPGILQARALEWVAISSSNVWKWKVKVKSLSPVRLLVTPWTAAYQAPLSMGFSRQESWSGVPLPSPSLSLTTHYLQHSMRQRVKFA